MPFTPVLAAALSGASTGQLAYWRSARTPEPLLAPARHQPGSRVSYSFRDVVALRTFVYLRSQGVALRRVREAVAALRRLGHDEHHLSEFCLVATGQGVVWLSASGEAIDLSDKPDHEVLAHMSDIIAPFVNLRNENVVDLRRPAPGVCVDPGIRSGFPVIEGTRIPYDLVAGLVDDNYGAADIADIYPSVTVDAARGAGDFALYVRTFERPRVAA